jgi:hypothetical protein
MFGSLALSPPSDNVLLAFWTITWNSNSQVPHFFDAWGCHLAPLHTQRQPNIMPEQKASAGTKLPVNHLYKCIAAFYPYRKIDDRRHLSNSGTKLGATRSTTDFNE